MSQTKTEVSHTKEVDGQPGTDNSYARLSKKELALYIITEILAAAFMTFCILEDSTERIPWIEASLENGWSWLGRHRRYFVWFGVFAVGNDIADFEWRFWYKNLWRLLFWYSGHFLLRRLLQTKSRKFRNVTYLVFAMLCIFQMFGWKVFLIFLAHCCIVFCAASFGDNVIVWVTSLSLMCIMNINKSQTFLTSLLPKQQNKAEFIHIVNMQFAMVTLRCISFSLEKVKNRPTKPESKETSIGGKSEETSKNSADASSQSAASPDVGEKPCDEYSFMDLLQYTFYMPLFSFAPIVTYDTFKSRLHENQRPLNNQKMLHVILAFVKIAFWTFFVELSLHYLYFSALMRNPHILKRLSRWTLVAIECFYVHLKMVQYVVFYSLAGLAAGQDGIDVSGPPSCIYYIYRFSDMWRLFNKGLYKFITRYIYIPMGGSKSGLLRQLYASLLCFVFFYFYRGLDLFALMWSLFAFVELVLEIGATLLEQNPMVQEFKSRFVRPIWKRRLRASFAVLCFLICLFPFNYFIAGKQMGDICVRRMLLYETWTPLIVMSYLLYCHFQIAIEFEKKTEAKFLKLKKD